MTNTRREHASELCFILRFFMFWNWEPSQRPIAHTLTGDLTWWDPSATKPKCHSDRNTCANFGPSGSKMKDQQKQISLHEWSLSANDHFADKWTYEWWRVIFCSLFCSAFCNRPICSAHNMISVNCVECLISVGAETFVLHCCQLRCDVGAIFKVNPLRANNRRCCQHWVRTAACTMALVLWLSEWLFVAIITASIIATKPATHSHRANPLKRRRESVFVLLCCNVVYEI